MAKKNNPSTDTTSSSRKRTTTRRRSDANREHPPVDVSRSGASKPGDTVSDMSAEAVGARGEPAPYSPSYDEIAEAAYVRYLGRGGNHGGDFDDWVEAERQLRMRSR